jgi:hypothetical protein
MCINRGRQNIDDGEIDDSENERPDDDDDDEGAL